MINRLLVWLRKGEVPSDAIDFLDERGAWNCIQCGACCRDIRWVYPEMANEEGVCKHLLENDRCEIYEDRPHYCRIANARSEGDDARIARACSWLRKHYPSSNDRTVQGFRCGDPDDVTGGCGASAPTDGPGGFVLSRVEDLVNIGVAGSRGHDEELLGQAVVAGSVQGDPV